MLGNNNNFDKTGGIAYLQSQRPPLMGRTSAIQSIGQLLKKGMDLDGNGNGGGTTDENRRIVGGDIGQRNGAATGRGNVQLVDTNNNVEARQQFCCWKDTTNCNGGVIGKASTNDGKEDDEQQQHRFRCCAVCWGRIWQAADGAEKNSIFGDCHQQHLLKLDGSEQLLVHSACFRCATCGLDLIGEEEQRIVKHADRFYCALHGQQQKKKQQQNAAAAVVGQNGKSSFCAAAQNVPFSSTERKVPPKCAAIDHGEAWKTTATIAAEHHRTDSSGEKKNINNDGQQLQKWWERKTEEFNGGKGSTTFRYYGANNGQRTVVPPPVPPKLSSSSSIGTGNAKFGQNRVVAGGHHGDAAGAMPRGKHKNISIPPPAQGHIGVGGGRRCMSPSSVAEDRCEQCGVELSGSFVLAKNRCWCPEHFVCANSACARCLLESGFVEEPQGRKNYCPVCYECLIAPVCRKCFLPLTETCLNALGEKWHTECFTCTHCRKPFGTHSFFVEDGKPYCEDDWNMLFTTKCSDCAQPIKVGQKWLEALGGQFHANCFKCAACGIELEGKTYFERAQRPFCRAHATAAAAV